MFDIAFINDNPETSYDGRLVLRGRTILGTHSEEFLATLGPWQRAEYERHWIEAAQRLLAGSDRTGFFTSAFQLWRTMWRQGSEVIVHERLLIEATLIVPWDPGNPYEQIPDYSNTLNEEGDSPSEWPLSIDDIKSFVDRRGDGKVH